MNGATVTVPQHPVVLRQDTIQVDGKVIDGGVELTQQHLYFLVNKPKGYLCSNKPGGGNEGKGTRKAAGSGGGGNRLVLDLFEDWRETWRRKHPGKLPPRLFTVGRLDVNTTGRDVHQSILFHSIHTAVYIQTLYIYIYILSAP